MQGQNSSSRVKQKKNIFNCVKLAVLNNNSFDEK
jgi:hypothetical protein